MSPLLTNYRAAALSHDPAENSVQSMALGKSGSMVVLLLLETMYVHG